MGAIIFTKEDEGTPQAEISGFLHVSLVIDVLVTVVKSSIYHMKAVVGCVQLVKRRLNHERIQKL